MKNIILSLLAAVFAVPEMPEAEWDDTEVVTNAALPAARADSRVFAFTLELDATARRRQATTSRLRSGTTRITTAFFRGARQDCSSAGTAESGRL